MKTSCLYSMQDELVELEHQLFYERQARGGADARVLELETKRSALAVAIVAERRARVTGQAGA